VGKSPCVRGQAAAPTCKCLMSASEKRCRDMSYRGNTFNVRTSRERIERILIRWHGDGPVQLLLHRAAKRLRGGRIAVNEI